MTTLNLLQIPSQTRFKAVPQRSFNRFLVMPQELESMPYNRPKAAKQKADRPAKEGRSNPEARQNPPTSKPQVKRKYGAPSNMTAIFIKCGKVEYGPLRSPKEIAMALVEIIPNPPHDARWAQLLSLIAEVDQEVNFFISKDGTEFYFTVQKRNC